MKKIEPSENFKKQLIKAGRPGLTGGFYVDEEDFYRFTKECRYLHPEYDNQQVHDWAAYSAIHNLEKKKSLFRIKSQTKKYLTDYYLVWAWRIAILVLLIFGIYFIFPKG